MNWEALTSQLADRGISATAEFPGYLDIPINVGARYELAIHVGIVNGPWEADIIAPDGEIYGDALGLPADAPIADVAAAVAALVEKWRQKFSPRPFVPLSPRALG